jgi:hypothetical protein
MPLHFDDSLSLTRDSLEHDLQERRESSFRRGNRR